MTGDAGPLPAAPGRLDGSLRDGRTVAGWVLVSRLTGFVRIAVVGAVLGPTYLGNTFVAMNLVPNLLYELLTGSLLVALIVPPLVRRLERDPGTEQRFAGSVFGLVTVSFGAVALLLAAFAPLLVRAFAATASTPDAAADQRRAGLLLLLLFLPQIVLYAAAAVGAAAMNARRHFALAAAAPIMENVGIVATLLIVALRYGTGTSLDPSDPGLVLLLGVGTTLSVFLHAATQWVGAWRTGTTLRPNLAGLRDPECRALMGRAVPSLGYAGLNCARLFATLVVANRLPGGVIAFQLAQQVQALPVALAARPVAVALLPRLSRMWARHDVREVREHLSAAAVVTVLLTLPAALGVLVLAWPLARGLSFGAMNSTDAVVMITLALMALAPSVLGESLFVLYTQGAYGMDDARSPMAGMVARAGFALVGIAVALLMPLGPWVLFVLGVAISCGDLAGAHSLHRRLARRLPPSSSSLAASVLSAAAAGLVMCLPSGAVGLLVPIVPGKAASLATIIAAAGIGAVTYFKVLRMFRPDDVGALRAALLPRGRSAADGARNEQEVVRRCS